MRQQVMRMHGFDGSPAEVSRLIRWTGFIRWIYIIALRICWRPKTYLLSSRRLIKSQPWHLNHSKVDKDKNGSIGYGEFLEMVLRQVRWVCHIHNVSFSDLLIIIFHVVLICKSTHKVLLMWVQEKANSKYFDLRRWGITMFWILPNFTYLTSLSLDISL